MSKASKKKQDKKLEPVYFRAELRQQIIVTNHCITGARMALGVPANWPINREMTAFVPPPEMPKKEE